MDNIINKIVNLIKEQKSSKDIDPKLKSWIEDKYGPWDENDFLSDDLDTYFKYESTSEGGGVQHEIIRLPSFGELIKQLKNTRDAANALIRGESVRDDEVLRGIYDKIKNEFNKFRTHLRKEYPAFYTQLKGQLTEEEIDEISTGGGGAGSAGFTPGTGMTYATPYAFKRTKKKQEPIPENKISVKIGDILTKDGKKGKVIKVMDDMANVDFGNGDVYGITFSRIKGNKILKEGINLNAYGYKLVPKDKDGNYVQKGSKLDVVNIFEDQKEYQSGRIKAFDIIEQEMNDIYKMLSNAKNETSEYYNDNPSSYTVVKPTDLVLDYIKDIKDLLKGEQK